MIYARLLNAVVLVPADRLIPPRISQVAHQVATGQPEHRRRAVGTRILIIACAYRMASHCIGLPSWRQGASPKKPGTRNRMNLEAGGDRVRSLGWFGSTEHVERRSFLLTTFVSFCADIMIVKVARKKKEDGTLADRFPML